MLTKLANSCLKLNQRQFSTSLFSKYGHFWLQQNKMVTVKIQPQGFKTAVHKPVGDVTNAPLFIQPMVLIVLCYSYCHCQHSQQLACDAVSTHKGWTTSSWNPNARLLIPPKVNTVSSVSTVSIVSSVSIVSFQLLAQPPPC